MTDPTKILIRNRSRYMLNTLSLLTAITFLNHFVENIIIITFINFEVYLWV